MKKPPKNKPAGKLRMSGIAKNFHACKNITAWHGLLPLAIFLITTLPAGLFLAFNVPAMWAADGGAHTARAFQIAEGGMQAQFIAHQHGDGYGGNIPVDVIELKNYELGMVGRSPAVPGQETSSRILNGHDKAVIAKISEEKISKGTALISFVNTAAYSPAAYTPIALGVWAGIKLNFSLGHTLLLARLCGLFTFIVCVGYGLFTLRKSQLKWIVMTVAMLPLVVFQASAITADSFLLSISLLFSALILKGLSPKLNLTLVDKILIFICVALLPLLKSTYFPLVFIILLLPRRHWPSQVRYWLWAGTSLAISMVGFGIWSHLTSDVATSIGLIRTSGEWTYGDATIQKHFIFSHPFGYLHVLIDTLLYNTQDMVNTFFSWLGFTYLPIPGIAEVTGFLALGLSVLLAGTTTFRKYVSGIALAILAATVLIIFTTLFVFYNSPGTKTIGAIQGRYFLPLAPLALAGLADCLPKLRIQANGLSTAKTVLVCLISFCFIASMIRYGLAITT